MTKNRSRTRLFLAVLLLVTVSLGCALMQQPTPFVFPTATPGTTTETPGSGTSATSTLTPPPSETAIVSPSPTPFPSATPQLPTATTEPPTPTWTPLPTPGATLPPDATRVVFESGATAATVSGNLADGATRTYVLGIAAGQLLDITMSSEETLQMEVHGVDGSVIAPLGPAFFRGTVPATQDYFVTVVAPPGGAAYTLNIIIPVRITFDAGATTAQVETTIPPFTTRHYVIRALGGQTMTFDTTASQGQVIAIVYGADGTVLQSDHAGSPDFEGVLPFTQDYLVHLRSVGSVPAIVTVDITIPPP